MDFWKNPKVIKAFWLSAILVILNALGIALIQASSQSLSLNVLVSALFLQNLVVIAIFSLAYDYLRKKRVHWKDAVSFGILGGIVLTTMGVLVGTANFASVTGAVLGIVLLTVIGWISIEVADRV